MSNRPAPLTEASIRVTETRARAQKLMAEMRAAREAYRQTMARSADLMAARYATGEYPTPANKGAWLEAMVATLIREGVVAPDHTGTLQITVSLHGGGVRRYHVDDVFRMVAA